MEIKKQKIKGHHILILLVLLFLCVALILSLVRTLTESSLIFRSNYRTEDVQERLNQIVPQRLIDHKLSFLNQVGAEQIGKVYIAIFKNESEIELWIPEQKSYTSFQTRMISPGVGLKTQFTESTFPEGVYAIKDVGLNDKAGYFIQLDYPSKKIQKDQKIKIEEFKHDAILITKEALYPSHVLLDEDVLEDLVYIIMKLGLENVKIAVFPQRPPLKMEINGTQVLAEIYSELSQLYKEQSGALYESK